MTVAPFSKKVREGGGVHDVSLVENKQDIHTGWVFRLVKDWSILRVLGNPPIIHVENGSWQLQKLPNVKAIVSEVIFVST